MKKYIITTALASLMLSSSLSTFANDRDAIYHPSESVKQSQKEFASDRFGIFIHWGIYSMFAMGEWFLNNDVNEREYSKAAKAFYPNDFNAEEWVKAIKDSGAKYITFTTRHHDGFSMWDTAESDYNIVDGTPFKRDVLKELSQACQDNDIKLHLYYSHLDWRREDYPQGRTGKTTGRDTTHYNYDTYYKFMNNQLTELLTNYGPIRAIWFDGYWDHDEDSIPFNWRLNEQYAMVHDLQPGCLIANNHHENIIPGEDIQIFERDLPGENTAGYSSQDISKLPLETCNTMNGMWGYKVRDTDYKDATTLIRYLVKAAGIGANLLLNIGPQPNGELPEQSLDRLKKIGEWMKVNSETIYDTEGGDFGPQSWGVATRKGNRLFVHIMTPDSKDISLPLNCKIKSAKTFNGNKKIKYSKTKNGYTLHLDSIPEEIDYIVELETK